MPVVVLKSPSGLVPIIYTNDDAEVLLTLIRALPWCPDLANTHAARQWLEFLQSPFGWFDQLEDLSNTLGAL